MEEPIPVAMRIRNKNPDLRTKRGEGWTVLYLDDANAGMVQRSDIWEWDYLYLAPDNTKIKRRFRDTTP